MKPIQPLNLLTPLRPTYPEQIAEPLRFVPTRPAPDAPPDALLEESLRDRILIDVIHDGAAIPAEFMVDGKGNPIPLSAFESTWIAERDWGANLVAERVAGSLGLPGFHSVQVARVLMDFGRFPGETREGADHLHRFALNYPFSTLLGYRQKRRVFEDLYDRMSDAYDRIIRGRIVKIGIHTYDPRNASGTQRPDVSVITRSVGYQAESRMPVGIFDESFPDILAEFTSDRILRDRISLTLEKARVRVAHNYPYLLPEGSLEVRAQVWFFYAYAKRCFEAEFPDTAGQTSFQIVWEMLMDTNLRSSASDALRSYLHLFRRAPAGRKREFARARDAYKAIRTFIEADVDEFIEQYRFSLDRPSCIVIEVRKDLVYTFDKDGRPQHPRHEEVRRIGDIIATALATYFRHDKADLAASLKATPALVRRAYGH